VIPLRYATHGSCREDLAPLVNGNADFTSNASSNALVITDTSRTSAGRRDRQSLDTSTWPTRRT
jgi:hypothetical protein